MATGALVGALNHAMHEGDDDNVRETRIIRSAVGNSKTVQRVENSVMNENGAVNIVLQVLDKLSNKAAGTILNVIDGIKFCVDKILPKAEESLRQEYYRKVYVPFTYSPGSNSNGYMGSDGVWHPKK